MVSSSALKILGELTVVYNRLQTVDALYMYMHMLLLCDVEVCVFVFCDEEPLFDIDRSQHIC